MTSAATGRHCAACEKTVVDFTVKTDAEILAYLAKAASGRTCGRFAAEQLERPLLPPTLPAPAARWRAWLAAAAAVWGLRETAGITAGAQVPVEMQRKMGKPVITDQLHATRKPDFEGTNYVRVLRGIVRDSATHEGLPGVTVLISNSTIGVSTDRDGLFELTLPADYVDRSGVGLRISSLGYRSEERYIQVAAETQPLEFVLRPDNRMMGEVVVTVLYRKMPPAPWHPRRFYGWGKYWLTRPFRRS